MLHEKKKLERRQHKRYKAQDLIIAFQHEKSAKVAQIINISRGGLAVRYVDEGEWLGNTKEVNILKEIDLLMTDVPVSVIRDFRYTDEEHFTLALERQSCMEFGELSPTQQDRLDYLIMKHCWGEA
jgi:hypothetical protein